MHRISQTGQPDPQGGGKQPDWAQMLYQTTADGSHCGMSVLAQHCVASVVKSDFFRVRSSSQISVERPVRLLTTDSLLFDVAALSPGCPAASATDDPLVLRGGRPLPLFAGIRLQAPPQICEVATSEETKVQQCRSSSLLEVWSFFKLLSSCDQEQIDSSAEGSELSALIRVDV